MVDNPTGTELHNCILKLAQKSDNCEENSKSERSEVIYCLDVVHTKVRWHWS